MTDTAAARAYPPEPEEDASGPPSTGGGPGGIVVEAFPPAAHTHALGASGLPSVSPSSTAVLDSQPPLGFPHSSSQPAGATADGEAGHGEPAAMEPPPFGFNAPPPPAPAREADLEPSQDLAGQAAPPARGFDYSPVPRRALPPRELMPTSGLVERHRLGEAPTPSFGPPGRERSTGLMVFLSVITLGFYAVAWHRRVNQEMGDFDPRVHVNPARSAWAVALPLLAGLGASLAAAAVIVLDRRGVALDVPVTVHQAYIGLVALAVVPYLVMILPFSMVAVTMTAERVRVVEDHAGVTTDEQLRPSALVAWLLLPVIGGFVLMSRQQRSLNRIWRLARA